MTETGCQEHAITDEIAGHIRYEPAWPNRRIAGMGGWIVVVLTGETVQVDYCPLCGKKLPLQPIKT
jgi:hypothetical protein